MKEVSVVILYVTLLGIFLGSCLWLYAEPGFEPSLAALGALATLLADRFGKHKGDDKPSRIKMRQQSGNDSKNFQSAGDININNSNVF